MPLICLEGASGVGKTSTAREIAKKSGSSMFIIPEVNYLFERPQNEEKTWYFEKQVERFEMGKRKLETYDTVILDGDIFQPLSYNWCFDFQIYNQSLDFIYNFYDNAIKEGRIDFPDKYYYLFTEQKNLISRKENDHTRKRRNFEKHLKIAEPHKRYYETLNQFTPGYVRFIEATFLHENVNAIFNDKTNIPSKNSSEILEQISSWLSKNKA